jgi:RNA polymerase sigma-70 factor, ECF subfamily
VSEEHFSGQPESAEAWMVGYQNGDREAANQLIECVSPALHRFFAMQTGDRRYADDLLQEALLRIHKARHTYQPGEPVMPWLYAIARYTKIDAFRRRRRINLEQSLASVPEPAVLPVQGGGSRDVESLLSHLPESQREVVSMLKISGLSLEEVARATSSSVGSVKQKAHRAYAKLRTLLSRKEGTA